MGECWIVKFAPALGLGALSLGTSAWAQDTAPQRRFDIGASAAAIYDSNFLRLPDEPAFGLERERDEVRLTPALTVDLVMPLGRQSVYLAGLVGYDFYSNNKELDRERIELRGGGNIRFSRCSSQLGVEFSRQQSDLADIIEPAPIKNAETRWLFSGDMSCRFGAALTPSVGYTHERIKNSDPARQTGNYSTDSVRGAIGFSRPAFGEIALTASYQRGRYDERGGPAGASDRIDTYTAGARFTRDFGSQLVGSVSAGWTKVNPNLPGVEPFSGLSYSADLTFTPGTRIQATIGAAREAQQSNLLAISYAIVDDYRAQATYVLSDRVRLSAGANYTKRSLKDSSLTPGAVLQDKDNSLRLIAGATYSPNYRLNLSLDASRERRRSSNDLFDYDNFMVALTTKLSI